MFTNQKVLVITVVAFALGLMVGTGTTYFLGSQNTELTPGETNVFNEDYVAPSTPEVSEVPTETVPGEGSASTGASVFDESYVAPSTPEVSEAPAGEEQPSDYVPSSAPENLPESSPSSSSEPPPPASELPSAQ